MRAVGGWTVSRLCATRALVVGAGTTRDCPPRCAGAFAGALRDSIPPTPQSLPQTTGHVDRPARSRPSASRNSDAIVEDADPDPVRRERVLGARRHVVRSSVAVRLVDERHLWPADSVSTDVVIIARRVEVRAGRRCTWASRSGDGRARRLCRGSWTSAPQLDIWGCRRRGRPPAKRAATAKRSGPRRCSER